MTIMQVSCIEILVAQQLLQIWTSVETADANGFQGSVTLHYQPSLTAK